MPGRTTKGSVNPPRSASDRPYHHGDLATSLLDAVCEIVREVGPGHVSLREAARRAGVSHAAPAHHFGNKRGLLTAFAADGFIRLGHAIRDEMTRRPPASGPDQLAALGRAYVRFAVANPERFSVMFRQDLLDADDPMLKAGSDGAWTSLRDAVSRCVSEGRVARRDADTAATAAWSLVHGLADLWNGGRLQPRIDAGGEVALERLSDAVTALFVGGLSPTALTSARSSRPTRPSRPTRESEPPAHAKPTKAASPARSVKPTRSTRPAKTKPKRTSTPSERPKRPTVTKPERSPGSAKSRRARAKGS